LDTFKTLKIIKDSVLAGIPLDILKRKVNDVKNEYFPQNILKNELNPDSKFEDNETLINKINLEKTQTLLPKNNQNVNEDKSKDKNFTFSKNENKKQELIKKEFLTDNLKGTGNNYIKIFLIVILILPKFFV